MTAQGIDFSKVLSDKLPLFVVVIVVLAFLLLAVVFRSLLVPLLASTMNILSIGAALGAIVAAFQYGWLKPLLGFAQPGPIEVYLPVMMFAVLFGLSMDYEVFLVSRMHEEWAISRDNHRAVTRGQAETGRVITAAGLIMILVFLSFGFVNDALVIKEFGIGFAAAIIIDAFVVRTVLVPRSCTCSALATGGCPAGSTAGCPPCTSKAKTWYFQNSLNCLRRPACADPSHSPSSAVLTIWSPPWINTASAHHRVSFERPRAQWSQSREEPHA